MTVELPDEPIESIEIVLQARFRVVVRVTDDADPTTVPTLGNDFEQRQIKFSLTELHDLLPLLIAVANHAVEIQGQQVRLHLLE